MPSQTVYVPDENYRYAERTTSDDESVGKRLQELIQRGIEAEQNE